MALTFQCVKWSFLRVPVSVMIKTQNLSNITAYRRPQELLKSTTVFPSILCKFGKKTVAEETSLSEPPKRPTPPFLRFLHQELKTFQLDLKFRDRLAKLGQIWVNLDESKKSPYVNAYQSELQTYKKKYVNYIESLTPEQLRDIRLENEKRSFEKKSLIARRKLKKLSESLGKPKHPGNAISLFCSVVKKEGNYPKDAFLKYAIESWHRLSEEEKNVYKEKAKMQLIEYSNKLHNWEKKMIEEGRTDLVQQTRVANKKD